MAFSKALLGATVLVVTLTACAAADNTSTSNIPIGFPTIAPATADGVYQIDVYPANDDLQAADSDEPIQLAAAPTAELDVVTGSVDVATVCNRHLGAFTLSDGGRASFTLTGGTSDACADDLNAQDELLLQVLADTTTWSADGGRLIFNGDSGSMIWTRSS